MPKTSVSAPEEQYVYSNHPKKRFRSSGAVCGVRYIALRWSAKA